MAEKYPSDPFDQLPKRVARVGAHRSLKHKPKRWPKWLATVGAIVVLSTAGIYTINLKSSRLSFANPTVAPTPTVIATLDLSLQIALLNGTNTPDAPAHAKSLLTAAGLKVISATESDTPSKVTTIFYEKSSQLAAALGIAKVLGGAKTELADKPLPFPGTALVAIGSDFVTRTTTATTTTPSPDPRFTPEPAPEPAPESAPSVNPPSGG